jgi:hypothetical protein
VVGCVVPNYYEPVSATWQSYNQAVASVNNSGLVTGLSGGAALIRATKSGLAYSWTGQYCEIGGYPTYWNTGTANVCDLAITSPAEGQVFDLAGTNYNSATLPLAAQSACSGSANWTFNFSYTSARNITYTGTGSTSTPLNPIGNYQTTNYQTPVGKGGQINSTAQATLAGHSVSKNRVMYVDGTQIPDTTIFSRLASLYSGATPLLLKGICFQESSFKQFVLRSLYQVSNGRWPYENAANEATPAGTYVGLMQVPNGMANAFDWLTNTSQGAIIFQNHLGDANNYVSGLRSQYPQLPALNDVQLENETLSYYGGFATRYYGVNADHTGWVVTTRQALLDYVDTIRLHSQ